MTATMRTRGAAAPARSGRFGVRLDARRVLVAANDLAAVSAIFRGAQREIEDRTGFERTLRGAKVYDLSGPTPHEVARVSQNGRVWNLADALIFDPYAADAEGGAR